MKRNIRTLGLFFVLVALFSSLWIGHAANQTNVIVDGTSVSMETVSINGYTYVPLRAFCQQMNDCNITWDAASKSAKVSCKGLDLVVNTNQKYVIANGRYFYLPNGVYCGSGALFLPVTVLAKCFAADVYWTKGNQALKVVRSGKTLESADTFYDSDDLYWMSHIIYAESGGEPFEGKIAVGTVVMNRVNNSRFPSTIHDVIFQKNQFSPVASGSIDKTPNAESIVAAKIALEGYKVAGNSTFFLNRAIAKSRWIESHCKYVSTIGHHTFYALAS